MAALKVWAHWTDGPPPPGQTPLPSAPFPPSFATYPMQGGAAPKMAYQPKWTGSGPITETIVGWFELVKQVDIDAARWSGPNFPGPPPPSGDQGYGPLAVGFRVTQITLDLPGAPGTDFEYTVVDPSGAVSATITPTGPGNYTVPVTTPFDGKGIWTVIINRQTGSVAAAPTLFRGPAGPGAVAVYEPYISPYGSPLEGILAIEFIGDEILCPTTRSLTAEKQVSTGWSSIVGSACVDIGQKVRLTANYANPSPFANTVYEWNFGDSPPQPPAPNTAHPINSQDHTYQTADLYAAAVSLKMPGCQTLLTKIIQVCWACPTSVTLSVAINGCAPTSASANFSVAVVWPPGPSPTNITYQWIVDGPTGKFEIDTNTDSVTSSNPGWKKTSPAPVTTGPLDLSVGSPTYAVSVTLVIDNMKSSCALGDTKQFEIKTCSPCPNLMFTASPVQGCAPGSAFAVLSVNLYWTPPTSSPPASAGYQWVITDPTGTKQATVTTLSLTARTDTAAPPWTGSLAKSNGTVDLDTPGTYQVEVTALFGSNVVFDPSCSRKATYTLNVPACPPCPVINSLTASPSAGTAPLNVTLTANVSNAGSIVPDASGNLYHWTFGDGGTADTVPSSTSHTYSTSGTFTAEVKVNVPANCGPAQASATVDTSKKTPTNTSLCGALLIAWLLLWFIGGILLSIGIAFSIFNLGLAGVIVLLAAILVMIIWIIVCHPTVCEVLKWLFIVNFALMMVFGFLAGCTPKFFIPALIWVGVVIILVIIILIKCDCDVLNWVVLLLTIAVAFYAGYYALAIQLFTFLAGISTFPAILISIFKFLSSCPPNKVVLAFIASIWATALIVWLKKRCYKTLV